MTKLHPKDPRTDVLRAKLECKMGAFGSDILRLGWSSGRYAKNWAQLWDLMHKSRGLAGCRGQTAVRSPPRHQTAISAHVSVLNGNHASIAHSLCQWNASGGRAAIAYVKGRRPLTIARGLCDVAWARARCFGSVPFEGVVEAEFPYSGIYDSGIPRTEGESVG